MHPKSRLILVETASLSILSSGAAHRAVLRRSIATQSASIQSPKPTGDISSVFPSLSGQTAKPLPPRFATLKSRLRAGHEDALQASWFRLLAELRKGIEEIRALRSEVIPEIEYGDIGNVEKRTRFRDGLRKRGVAVIRCVVSAREALGCKELLSRYIATNQGVKGRQSV